MLIVLKTTGKKPQNPKPFYPPELRLKCCDVAADVPERCSRVLEPEEKAHVFCWGNWPSGNRRSGRTSRPQWLSPSDSRSYNVGTQKLCERCCRYSHPKLDSSDVIPWCSFKLVAGDIQKGFRQSLWVSSSFRAGLLLLAGDLLLVSLV